MPAKYEFTKAHANYAMKRIAQGASYQTIWLELKAEDAKRACGCAPYAGPYAAFAKRCSRIKPDQVDEYRVKRGATPKEQMAFLTNLINSSRAKNSDKLRAVEMLQKMQAAEADAKTQSGKPTRVMLADPRCVEITVEMMTQLLFALRDEVGGFDKLDFSGLAIGEIRTLIDVLQDTVDRKIAKEEAIDVTAVDGTPDLGGQIDPDSL